MHGHRVELRASEVVSLVQRLRRHLVRGRVGVGARARVRVRGRFRLRLRLRIVIKGGHLGSHVVEQQPFEGLGDITLLRLTRGLELLGDGQAYQGL